MYSILPINEILALLIRALFWIALALYSLPQLVRVYRYYFCGSLAGEFARECRRRAGLDKPTF